MDKHTEYRIRSIVVLCYVLIMITQSMMFKAILNELSKQQEQIAVIYEIVDNMSKGNQIH